MGHDKLVAFAFLEFVIASIRISNDRSVGLDFYWDHFILTEAYTKLINK